MTSRAVQLLLTHAAVVTEPKCVSILKLGDICACAESFHITFEKKRFNESIVVVFSPRISFPLSI